MISIREGYIYRFREALWSVFFVDGANFCWRTINHAAPKE